MINIISSLFAIVSTFFAQKWRLEHLLFQNGSQVAEILVTRLVIPYRSVYVFWMSVLNTRYVFIDLPARNNIIFLEFDDYIPLHSNYSLCEHLHVINRKSVLIAIPCEYWFKPQNANYFFKKYTLVTRNDCIC